MASLSLLSAVLDQPTRLEDRARRDAAGLMRALESVTDLRKRRGRRFELVVVLALAVLAVCCGASSFAVVAETVADLERRLLVGFGLGCRRPPSAATFRRVLNVVDPGELDEALDRPGFGGGSVSPRPACRPRADPVRARAGGFSVVSPDAGVNRVPPWWCAAPREWAAGQAVLGLPRALGCPGTAEVSGVKGGPQARRGRDRAATLEAGGAGP